MSVVENEDPTRSELVALFEEGIHDDPITAEQFSKKTLVAVSALRGTALMARPGMPEPSDEMSEDEKPRGPSLADVIASQMEAMMESMDRTRMVVESLDRNTERLEEIEQAMKLMVKVLYEREDRDV